MREDGYVNAKLLCKAGKKEFKHWNSNKQNKDLIQALKSDVGIPASQLIDVKKGNTSKYKQGSWIHPDLAIQLAQWISPHFAIQVSKWTRELLLFGKVELGKEKTTKQLDNKLQEQIQILQLQLENKEEEIEQERTEKEQERTEKETTIKLYKTLKINHNKILKKRKREDYETGSVIYIISHMAFINHYKCIS
jgi:hypothetical protein